MKTENIIKNEIEISKFNTGQFSSVNCITINGREDSRADGMIRKEAQRLKAMIFRQFVFADRKMYVLSLKKTAAAGAPVTSLCHTIPGRKGFFSAQAVAFSGMRNVKSVNVNGRKIGFTAEDVCARYCFLGNVLPQNIHATRPEQAESVFNTFNSAMTRHEFVFTDTVRTWFFNDHITDWYGEFNKVRTDFFNKTGIFAKTVPASTGIGAGNPYGTALTGNLFAVQPRNGRVKITAVPSPMQESALNYKSSFSRAVEIEYPAYRCLYISGTASISKDGKTLFAGNVASQIDTAMRIVAALLQSRKMNWENLSRGVVYLKRPDYLEYFKDYCRKHEISSANLAFAFTDMCRNDLLFEIELDALVSK